MLMKAVYRRYVLTGGEMPAIIVMDAISRFIPGVLGKIESAEEDSFSTGLLEYPQYTRPVNFEAWRCLRCCAAATMR